MDLATLAGLLLAIISFLGAFILEGGSLGMLMVLTAAIIVFGGTIAATVMSFTLDDIRRLPYFVKRVFVNQRLDYHSMLELLVGMTDKARREGFLSLENDLETIDNEFLIRGLQLVIDGTSPELTEEILELEIEAYEARENVGSEMFMTAGGYAPTIGIIGTVMGMVNVLSSLSKPEELGAHVAVAFLATLYGIISANILFIPFSSKLKIITRRETQLKEMILTGILSIQAGDNPRVLREKLTIFLPPETKPRFAGSMEEERNVAR